MPTYIITWHGMVGEVWRTGTGGYQPVMFLHCLEAEAREIAEDLGAMFLTPKESRDKYVTNLDDQDCPSDCEHARYYGLPTEVIRDVNAIFEAWQQ